jgi:putative exporter of polyketide antibiotics
MKTPLINFPSLGSIHAKGYWISLFVLMFGGVLIFLHYVFIVTMAVPMVGAFSREPKLIWRSFAVATLISAIGYLLFRFIQDGSQGLIFFYGTDSFGFSYPQMNSLSFLVVASIFLPLSGACALHRIHEHRKRAEQDVTPNA